MPMYELEWNRQDGEREWTEDPIRREYRDDIAAKRGAMSTFRTGVKDANDELYLKYADHVDIGRVANLVSGLSYKFIPASR